MKTRIINLTAHEARAFQRGATILVREVRPQPPSIEAVKKLSGSDYGWMDCSDMGRPSEFRVVGPVWAVRQLEYPQFVKPPYQPGDLLIGREAWRILGWIPEEGEVQVFYKSDPKEKYWALPVRASNDPNDIEQAQLWVRGDFEINVRELPSFRVINDRSVDGGERYEWDETDLLWRSSSIMPQWAARVRRIVTDVSLKRCQDLTEGEIEETGCNPAERVCDYCGWVGTWEELADNKEGDDEDCHRCPECDDETDGWYVNEQYRKAFAKANPKMWDANKFVWVVSVKEEA